MSTEKLFLQSVHDALNLGGATEIIESLAKLNCPKLNNLSFNSQVLANYISQFQFDWEEEAYDMDHEEEFATETVEVVKRILRDIESRNKYSQSFRAELAYSHLEGDNYQYLLIHQNMSSETAKDAKHELAGIAKKAPKNHPDNNKYTLEDVRLRVEVVDNKGRPVFPDSD
jgi:hypothetical protein